MEILQFFLFMPPSGNIQISTLIIFQVKLHFSTISVFHVYYKYLLDNFQLNYEYSF